MDWPSYRGHEARMGACASCKVPELNLHDIAQTPWLSDLTCRVSSGGSLRGRRGLRSWTLADAYMVQLATPSPSPFSKEGRGK